MKLYVKAKLTAALLWGTASLAMAQGAVVATVNGVAIPSRWMERNVQANVAQGQADTPALRSALREELIARELMVQEAQRRGLDKQQEIDDALKVMRQNVLIDALVQDELKKTPITDADLRTEYDRQVKSLGPGELSQYQVATIVVESESEARAVMASLRGGQSFDALARSRSLDASKERGGELGWFLPDQITPAISNVVVNLAPGAVSAAPIQVGPSWHVVRLLAKRPYQVPGFEDSRPVLQAAVVQARRLALLRKLRETAKIAP